MEIRKRGGKSIAIDIDGDTLNVVYRDGAYTPRLVESLSEAESSGDGRLAVQASIDTVVALVDSWDLTDNGEPVPITREALSDVPFLILAAVVTSVGKASAANPTK